jgi:hypothetical protein
MGHGLRKAGAYALVVVLGAGLGQAAPVVAGAATQPVGLGGATPGTESSIEETGLGWEARFFGPGLDTGESSAGTGGAGALAVWDDGTGPALYAGGWTLTAGRHEVSRIARWDGHEWSPLTGPDGTGVWMAGSGNPSVNAMAVYDGALIAAGFFDRAGGVAANNIARWDGTEWSALGAGVTGGIGIQSLTVHDGALYAAGSFTAAGGEPASRVARWDGEQWTPLGGGMPSGSVYALASYGGDLYAGGSFTQAGGAAATNVARWDGAGWSEVGAGVNNFVRALTVHDGRLVVGGAFTTAGGQPANRIAGWDGEQWSTFGAGMSGGRGPTVFGLGGYAGALVAAGAFHEAGGVTVSYIARWDGDDAGWSPLAGPAGTGMDNGVSAVVEYDGALIAGSAAFREAGGVVVNYIARWDGDGWSALDGGPATGLAGPGSSLPTVHATTIWNGELVVAGQFAYAGGQRVNRIARWDGATWTPLAGSFGAGMNGSVSALAVYQGDLIAGGSFSAVGGGLGIDNLARFDGTEWSPVATPGSAGGTDGSVSALAVHDGELVIGGSFTSVDGRPAGGIARWNGTRWSGLGTGMNNTVYALAVHDGDLLAGGGFTQAGAVAANRIARWDGAGWSPVGGGANGAVFTMAVHDGALYAGGEFTQAGGVTVNRIARWNGAGWSPLGGGVDRRVVSLAGYRGELYMGGDFTQVDGAPVNQVARWDGEQWSPLTGGATDGIGGSVIPSVRSLLPYDADGAGPVPEKLAIGGRFQLAGGVSNWGLAMYGPTDPLTHLTVSPGEAGFAPVPSGETSGPLTVTLTGSGNQPVEVSSVPEPAAPFRQTAGGDCPATPFTLAPTESCTLGYEFTPPAAGEYAQTLPIGNSGTPATLTLTGTGLAGPPAIDVDPAELGLELTAGETGSRPLGIGNLGEADLSWEILDQTVEAAAAPAPGLGVQAETAPGEDAPARAAGGETTPPEEHQVSAADGTVLSHSESMEVHPGGGITCSNTATGHSRGSQFLRTFRLSDFDIHDEFLVTDVTFGVERVHPDLEVTVNLYTMDGSLRYEDLDLLASQAVAVHPEQDGRLVTVPVRTVVPAGSTLVVELATDDLLGTGWFYPGANDQGESAPSYFASEACGYPEPTSMASVGFGFPDVHLVMAVTGRDPVDCQRPEWLDVSPAGGTTTGGGSSEVTVTFDASGLAPGDYAATLCVASDDPASSLVTVPVSLTVTEDAGGCDETITGVHAGALAVTEGVTCLAAGAQVLGEVNVVQGPVSAIGAARVELVFSQVTGPVLVTGADQVSLFGSQVTGSVTLLGSGGPTVAGNTIIGSLSCFGNEPPPADHGLPNTATGGKLGQCATL